MSFTNEYQQLHVDQLWSVDQNGKNTFFVLMSLWSNCDNVSMAKSNKLLNRIWYSDQTFKKCCYNYYDNQSILPSDYWLTIKYFFIVSCILRNNKYLKLKLKLINTYQSAPARILTEVAHPHVFRHYSLTCVRLQVIKGHHQNSNSMNIWWIRRKSCSTVSRGLNMKLKRSRTSKLIWFTLKKAKTS